jgi:hypothetical protein
MSQSDLLKRKRISTILRIDSNKQPSVFNSQSLTDFTQYQLENTIESTNQLYNQSIPAGKMPIFNMMRNISSCPAFIVCSGTDARPNRVLNFDYDKPQVSNLPLNWHETNDLNNTKSICIQCPP